MPENEPFGMIEIHRYVRQSWFLSADRTQWSGGFELVAGFRSKRPITRPTSS